MSRDRRWASRRGRPRTSPGPARSQHGRRLPPPSRDQQSSWSLTAEAPTSSSTSAWTSEVVLNEVVAPVEDVDAAPGPEPELHAATPSTMHATATARRTRRFNGRCSRCTVRPLRACDLPGSLRPQLERYDDAASYAMNSRAVARRPPPIRFARHAPASRLPRSVWMGGTGRTAGSPSNPKRRSQRRTYSSKAFV